MAFTEGNVIREYLNGVIEKDLPMSTFA